MTNIKCTIKYIDMLPPSPLHKKMGKLVPYQRCALHAFGASFSELGAIASSVCLGNAQRLVGFGISTTTGKGV